MLFSYHVTCEMFSWLSWKCPNSCHSGVISNQPGAAHNFSPDIGLINCQIFQLQLGKNPALSLSAVEFLIYHIKWRKDISPCRFFKFHCKHMIFKCIMTCLRKRLWLVPFPWNSGTAYLPKTPWSLSRSLCPWSPRYN